MNKETRFMLKIVSVAVLCALVYFLGYTSIEVLKNRKQNRVGLHEISLLKARMTALEVNLRALKLKVELMELDRDMFLKGRLR